MFGRTIRPRRTSFSTRTNIKSVIPSVEQENHHRWNVSRLLFALLKLGNRPFGHIFQRLIQKLTNLKRPFIDWKPFFL